MTKHFSDYNFPDFDTASKLKLAAAMAKMLKSLEVVCEYDMEFCPVCNACFNEECEHHGSGDPEDSDCNTGHADGCALRALLDDIVVMWPDEDDEAKA